MIRCNTKKLNWMALHGAPGRGQRVEDIARGILKMHRRRVAPVLTIRAAVATVLASSGEVKLGGHGAVMYKGRFQCGNVNFRYTRPPARIFETPEEAAAALVPDDWTPPGGES